MFTALLSLLGSASFVAVAGFVFSMGNRISVLETRQKDLPDLINARFNSVEQRLDRMERAMNGSLAGHD